MKFLILLFPLALLLVACGNEPGDGTVSADRLESTDDFVASPDQDTAKYRPLYLHKIPAASELANATTSVGAFGQVLAPPMERLEAQMLTKSYWVIEGYADSDASREQKIAATGQWLQCFPNGTFYAGHWDRHTHSGAWYMDYQGRAPRLTLDSNVDRMDAVWEIQGMTGDQASMAWVRIPDTGFGLYRGSLSVKVIELHDRPTRKQFANTHTGL